MNVRRKALLIAGAIAALPGTAWAQSGGAARALAPLVACRGVADPRAKANCYDAALDKLQNAVAGREVVIVDKQQNNEDRKALFGFNAERQLEEPAHARRERGPREPEVDSVDSTVALARRTGIDHWTIRLANGATWRTLEPGITSAPDVGDPVHIRRDALGKYMMRVGKSRSMRAIRVY